MHYGEGDKSDRKSSHNLIADKRLNGMHFCGQTYIPAPLIMQNDAEVLVPVLEMIHCRRNALVALIA